ncbi:hypothetical protein DRQ25_02645 [Candidatus Fermentibacteria bacterium]|nr:MAG: hypothetical protein DRQ25_02645 [Candidatus Fermentibacteria bacterium]
MKKLGLMMLVAGIILMAGCAGDDPAGPGGTLADVEGVAISSASDGQNIALTWTAIADVDGYKVWFRATSTGTYAEVDDVTTNASTVTATSAGYYVVTAYKGSDSSANNSTAVTTMPSDVTVTYTIYDRWCPADKHSGFIFGETSGQTGLASQTSFLQDIYAWDYDTDGDTVVYLTSGGWGTYGNGSDSWMHEATNASFVEVRTAANSGSGGPWYSQDYMLYTADTRTYISLSSGHYVKMYDLSIVASSETPRGTEVSFSYEYQLLEGVTVFSSK